ncbi:hypothetical protein AVEN_218895-1, partial [Araneus ventricosus]
KTFPSVPEDSEKTFPLLPEDSEKRQSKGTRHRKKPSSRFSATEKAAKGKLSLSAIHSRAIPLANCDSI